MTQQNHNNLPQTDRIAALTKERIEILSLPPEKALDRILDYPQPAALVHSFPEEDLYFLIHDIGPEDALPLLSLASHRQVDFILDMEIWEKDRASNSSLTRWFGLMLSADPQRFIKWLTQEKTTLLAFFLYHHIEIRIREHDQDPSDFGEDFHTFDDVYYYRILPDITDLVVDGAKESVDGITEEFRKTVIHSLVRGLAGQDHTTFQGILLESATLLPAESEEEAYRWRNVRLAEKGFLPFDEAVELYQPMSSENLINRAKAIKKHPYHQGTHLPTPLTPINMLEKNNPFSEALIELSLNDRFNDIQGEFASLCNQAIIADQKIVRSKEDLHPVVKKVLGYINIALDHIVLDKSTGTDAKELLLAYPLSHIFKVGYGLALSLKWQAQKWVNNSWFSTQGLSLTFWGEEWMGVLGGLLIKKPLFFDNYETGELYREFQSMEDIQKIQASLDQIMACDGLLSSMEIMTSAHGYLSYKNLLLTLWARHHLGLSADLTPLGLDEFKRFYIDLWEPGTKPKIISQPMKTGFLDFLSEKSGLTAHEITEQAGLWPEDLFLELESEYSHVDVTHLDPRFITLFLLEKQAL